MNGRSVVRAGLCVLAATMAAASGQLARAASAADRHIALNYEVHIGGIYGLKADAVLRVSGDRFMAEARVGKEGILSALSKAYRAVHTSRGRLVDNQVVPDGSVAQIVSGDEARALRASYGAGGALTVAENPPFEPKEGREVGAEQRRGAFDPLMAVIAAVLGRRDPCAGAVPVFDGRLRFDIEPRRIGPQKFEADGFELKGEAVMCEVRLRKLAGYKPETKPDENFDKPARLWLGALDDSGRLFPLRVEVDTSFGMAVGHLRRIDSRPLTDGERAAVEK